MKPKDFKDIAEAAKEYALNHAQANQIMQDSMRGFTADVRSTRKLWRSSNNSFLIKAGLALIAFPDPTISDIVGTAMVAAGLIQTKIKNSALHVDDVYKTFPRILKELNSARQGRI